FFYRATIYQHLHSCPTRRSSDLVAMDIARQNCKTEASLYPKFEKAIKKLFGDRAEIIKKINNPKHQPDAWVRLEDQDIPVEKKLDRKSTRLNSSHVKISYAVFCL